MTKNYQKAQNELNNIRKDVFGIFKFGTNFELVIWVGESTVSTFNITQFGAIQRNFSIPKDRGQLHLFPKGKYLLDMVDDVWEWETFMKQFK